MADNIRKRRERLSKLAQGQSQKSRGGGGGRKKGGFFAPRVSRKARTQFTVQLATLQDAGLPILRSLRILEGQAAKGPLKDTMSSLADEVEGGASLSDAMGKHPGVFDELFVNMVRAGEIGGALSTIFMRLADFMERSESILRKVRGALIYPIFIVVFASAILVILMTVIVPKFEVAFSSLGGELPEMTQMLISSARWCQDNWFLFPLVPVLIFMSLLLIGRTTKGRRFLDGVKLRMPLFGPIRMKSQIARFCRTLGTLSSSGVAILESLNIVGDASGNVVVKEGIAQIHDAVREGEPMAGPMAETGIFDDMVVNMVDVGEETGALDRMLMRIADNYEDQVETRVTAMMSLLEPILIVVMGVIVGFIVIALFLPLMSIQDLIS